MKHQAIFIHGGDCHDTYEEYIKDLKAFEIDRSYLEVAPVSSGWKAHLQIDLGIDFEVMAPEMPSWLDAKYVEWKIWFYKVLGFVNKEAVFIGHSLGGIFLAKYFAENNMPKGKKVRGIILVAPPFNDKKTGEGMADFWLPKDLSKLASYGDKLHLYFSKDDPVVTYSNLKPYADVLPKAKITEFKDKGHFRMEKFPEIVKDIKELYQR